MRTAPAFKAGAAVAISERTGKRQSKSDQVILQLVFTVPEFCRAHRISRAMFYLLRKQGKAPRLMHVGTRVLISDEAAADWRRAMEGVQ